MVDEKVLKIKAYAKINLTLDVLFKRPDGYHEVEMIMQSIDLADDLILREQPQGITVVTNRPDLPGDADNLAYRAARLLADLYDVDKGVNISLNKKIPLAAGLAGGSADAAGVLVGLNKLWNLGLSTSELADLGAKLGSDVPFCIERGTMLAAGRGEKLTRLPDMPECYVVLAKLPISVSTAWVYGNYRPELVGRRPDNAKMIEHLGSGNLAGVAQELCNVLETVTIAQHPEIDSLKRTMIDCGAMAGLMSGSGPTVFGLVDGEDRAAAVAGRLRTKTRAEVFVARTVPKMGEEG